MELTGRIVVVTGASRGIGAAIARSFAATGARVVLVARDADRLAALATELGATFRVADLSDPAQVEGLIPAIEADAGPVDVLVNNAGIEETRAIWSMSAEDVRGIVQVNLAAPIELSRQAATLMRGRDTGHIVNVSSLAGCVPVPGFSTYGATKAGLTHFTAGMRRDLKGSAVGTTLVQVGPVKTDMLAALSIYEPTRLAYRRLYRTGMMADTTAEAIARAVVAAVERGRPHVRLPRRSALAAYIAEIPRTVTNLITSGVRAE